MVKKRGKKQSDSSGSADINRLEARMKKQEDIILRQQVEFEELKKLLDFMAKEMKKYESIMSKIKEVDTLIKTIEEVKSKVKIINDSKRFVEAIGTKLEGIYIDLEKRFKMLRLNEDEIYRIQKRVQELGHTIEDIAEKTKEVPKLSDFKKHVLEVKSDVAKELNKLKYNVGRMTSFTEEESLSELRRTMDDLQGTMGKELADIKMKLMELEEPVHAETTEELRLLRDIQKLIKKVEHASNDKDAAQYYKEAYERYEKLRNNSEIDLSIIFGKLNDLYKEIHHYITSPVILLNIWPVILIL